MLSGARLWRVRWSYLLNAYWLGALLNTQKPIGQSASRTYVIMFALRTSTFIFCAGCSFSIFFETKYSDHHDTKKNGTKRTNPAIGIIQCRSDSYGINQAACNVTDSTLPSVVSRPKAPPPPESIWISTSSNQVNGIPSTVEARFEIVVVFTELEIFNSSFLPRYSASMRIIGIIDNPSAGITRNIIGTPAFAEATLGIHNNMHSANNDFHRNLFTVFSLSI